MRKQKKNKDQRLGSLSTGVVNLKSLGKSSAARRKISLYDCRIVTSATPAISPISTMETQT